QDTFIVITGKAKFFNSSSFLSCFTIKFTPTGDTLWSKIYDNPYLAARGWIISESNPKILYADNSIFLATLTWILPSDSGIGNDDILLSRLDFNNGDILKYRNFSSKLAEGDFIHSLTSTNEYLYISGIYSMGRNGGVSFGGW